MPQQFNRINISIRIILATLILSTTAGSSQAQSKKGDAAAAIAGGILTIGAAALEWHLFLEMLEQQAFDQIIKSEPEFESFRLKVLDLEGKKMSDMGAVSVLTFRVTRLDKMTGQELSRHVLMMYTSNGWMNQFGIDLSLVSWKMLDAEQWNNMYCAFLDLNTPIKIDENYTFNQITEIRRKDFNPSDTLQFCLGDDCYVMNPSWKDNALALSFGRKGLTKRISDSYGNVTTTIALPFIPLKNDDYLIADYSEEFKLFANEKSMGLFLKSSKRSVQLQRSLVSKIHSFINQVDYSEGW